MYGLNLWISGDGLRRSRVKGMTIASETENWTTKNQKFFRCDTLLPRTISSALPEF